MINIIKKFLDIIKERTFKFFVKNLGAIICLILVVLLILIRDWGQLEYNDILETIKISVTLLISMLGFSVSIYVFLNNTFQSRRISNELEQEVIDQFQEKARKKLGTNIGFSVIAITVECLLVFFQNGLKDTFLGNSNDMKAFFCAIAMILIACITVFNIYKLGLFTWSVINYEDGLKKLASKDMDIYAKDSCYEKITKGDFLNLVNNIEVIIERLIGNHLHAKISTAYDTDLKRAICDGITDPGEIRTREVLSEDYKKIIEYRNLLLQNSNILDSDIVAMGDQIKSVMNRLFQRYLKNELLTGISISNLTIREANLEKASFSNSSLQKIKFIGNTDLKNVDIRNSTINDIVFGDADCESINFSGCKLINVHFDVKVNLERAIFSNADLSSMGDVGPKDKEGDPINFKHTNFSHTNLTHQDIYNVCFDFSDFSNARLVDSKIGKSAQKKRNVSFHHANMEKVDLLRCWLERTDFQNANLNSAIFTYAVGLDIDFSESRLNYSNFSESDLQNCKFGKAYCSNMSLKGAKLKRCSFSYAIMRSADMSGTHLLHMNFTDAVCKDTLWIGIELKYSNFERCVLAGARIVGDGENKIRIENCDFLYTNFSDSAISNIEFYQCNFDGADFSGARLINVSFIDCKKVNTAVVKGIWMVNVSFTGNEESRFDMAHEDSWRYKRDITVTGLDEKGEK